MQFDLAEVQEWMEIDAIGSEIKENWRDLGKRFRLLKILYSRVTPKIEEYDGSIDPYFVDWVGVMTPIECNLWRVIRCYCLPFFPQYPVGRFFADFADPMRKVVIEADGKQWHDPEKDKKRDEELSAEGWTTYRYTGSETYRQEVLFDLVEQYKGYRPKA